MTPVDRVCVAQIGGPHGLRGEVKLKSFTADPMAVKDYAPLESEDGAARFEIEALRPAKGYLVARLRGIADRSAAEQLTHVKLFISRQRLPAPEPDEFYHADMIGMRAVTPAGDEIGLVHAIHDFGAGDILELQLRGSATTVMVPFTTTIVPEVDVADRRIVVVLPMTDDGGRRTENG
jgi:16S rRNA processing protein RimM